LSDPKSFESLWQGSSENFAALDAGLLAAHAAKDKCALVTLYLQAADVAAKTDAACFYLTHAYIFALDLGDPRAATLRARLVEHGRET
jgi:hypothetical protein